MINSQAMVWSVHRRHTKDCPHAKKGWNYTLCDCPVWADGTVNGRRVRRSLGTTDWNRALRRAEILERGGDLAPETISGPMLAEAVAAYLKDAAGRNLRGSTIEIYRETLEALTDKLGAKRLLDSIDVVALDSYRASRKIKPRTGRKELSQMRTFFAWCLDRKWIGQNPAKRLRMPKIDDVGTLPFTPEEVNRLLNACDRIGSGDQTAIPYIRRRARAMVYTLLYSGLRISDVVKLRRGALDESSRYLTLRTTKTGVPIKVQLHQDAVNALTTLPAQNPEYFFWTGRGSPNTCAQNMWRTIQRLGILAGIPNAHPHRFRDTFAVELLTQGADIRTVQKLLGHDSVRTTEAHYAHFVAAHQALLDAATARLDFNPKPARPLLVHSRKNRRRDAK